VMVFEIPALGEAEGLIAWYQLGYGGGGGVFKSTWMNICLSIIYLSNYFATCCVLKESVSKEEK
jgi:hypothetical protein